MNPIVLNEEETRTIKYLNKSHQLQDQLSESLTEKQYKRQMLQSLKKNGVRKMSKELCADSKGPIKIVVVEALEQQANQAHITRNPPPNGSKHKKGKSMDIEENLSKKDRIDYINNGNLVQNANKLSLNNAFINSLSERSSISQMKQYNISKKLGVAKKSKDENINLPKKKKSKITNQAETKIKKQIKSIFQATPLNLNFKKKQTSSKSSKSSRSNPNRGSKFYSKSHEIPTQRKVKSSHNREKSRRGLNEIKNIAETMPITSKMVSLYSNTSSVFSSRSEFQKIRRQSYVIPTQESIEEIYQIRKYESLTVRKSSGNLRKINLMSGKFILVDEIESEVEHRQPTQKIISQYLELLNSHQLEMEKQYSSSEMELSQIPHQQSLKEGGEEGNCQMMFGLNLLETHHLPQEIDTSQLSKEINHQQQELSKLNLIIETIQKREKSDAVGKDEILKQIKSLIASSHQQKMVQSLELVKVHEDIDEQGHDEVSSSGLKQSVNFEDSMEGVNLQILDKTLRERERFLMTQKERELQLLDEQLSKDQQWEKQRQKVEKWMNHQIKEVVHIRKQLWKGFNLAKDLIASQSKRENKKTQMIRCLSDKYLYRTYRKNKKEDSSLTNGRINDLSVDRQQKGFKVSQPELDEDSDNLSEGAEEMDSKKLQNQFNQYRNKLLKSENRMEFSGALSNESMDGSSQNKSLKSSQLLLPPTIGIAPSMGGLNLQKIECEIDYEDSLNSQEMEALARESEKARQQSLKIPYTMSTEDKEDIFQFIFLDLVIELSENYRPDSTIMRKISSFIRNMKEQAKKQKGFKTNTNAIRDYLFQFITFLKSKPKELEEVHLNLEKPLGPTALDILKYMHVYDEELNEEQNQTVFILDIKLFEAFEQTLLPTLEFQKYYEDEEKEKKRKTFLKNAIHIHNKSIFDALNETLDRERPFGVWGQPFSWKKAAKFYHLRDVVSKNSLILKSAQKTIQFGAYMCGFMIDKEDCNLKNNPNITQAYIEQIRDDRLSRLLANELDQGEEKMLFIDDEQTEILVEVGQIILQNLFSEMFKEMAGFS